MTQVARALGGIGLAAAIAGCASAPLPRSGGEPPPALADAKDEARYRGILDAHTRQRAVYDGLDLRFLVQATWHGPAFAAARAEREAAFLLQTASDAAAAAERERRRLDGAVQFFVAVHASDTRFDALDRIGGPWRLALRAGEREVVASSVERLGRASPALRAIYPYLESFWTGYMVRFPRVEVPPGEALRLRLASTLGHVELAFDAKE